MEVCSVFLIILRFKEMDEKLCLKDVSSRKSSGCQVSGINILKMFEIYSLRRMFCGNFSLNMIF